MEWKYPYKTNPFDHQREALKKSADAYSFAYFMEMGTGKTKTAIDNMGYLYMKKEIDTALIIAPKSVYTIWCNEIDAHLPDVVKRDIFQWKIDKPKRWDYFKKSNNLKIFLINVEALSNRNGFETVKKFIKDYKNNFVVIDESTTIKNPKAKRTKNILAMRHLARYRRVMTGSPVTKNPLDLYTQCEFLDPALLDFPSYYAFRNRYAEMRTMHVGGRSIQVVHQFRNLDELSDSIKSFSYRVLKEDCLDLPPKIFMEREIELSKEQQKVYEQMRKEATAFLNGKRVSTMTVLTQLMRLQQITCGHFTADDGTIQDIKNNRIDELMDVLDEVEGKAIIWGHFQRDVETIFKAIEKEYGPGSAVHYYGKTLPEQRDYAIDAFQKGKARFFVGTPATGGYGLTLTAANTVIYYSNGYDLEKRMQSEDRAHRIGSKSAVTYINLIAQDTVDQKIVKSLRKKINIASEVMGEELRKWI